MPPIDQSRIQPYSQLELLAKQVVEGFITGLHRSPFHGFSVEFAEHRLYNSGESTRHVDWKLYAKTDRLFMKRYEEETNLRCRLLLDVSSSMNFPEKGKEGRLNKVEFSIHAAAAIVELLRKQRDAFGLSFFSEALETHTEAKSSSSHQRLLYNLLEEKLNAAEQLKSTAAIDVLHQVSEMIQKRSLVIIFSDMMDETEREQELLSALQHLRHNHHEVILFHVLDADKELSFDFENRPYRFIDLESGEQLKLNPAEGKEKYVQQAKEREQSIKLKCGQLGVDYVKADVGKNFDQILLPFFMKRKKMY